MVVRFPLSEDTQAFLSLNICPSHRLGRRLQLCSAGHGLRELGPGLHLSGPQPLHHQGSQEVMLHPPEGQPGGHQHHRANVYDLGQSVGGC